MSSRDKDNSDFDLEQFVDLFDTAMSSDNPAVKRALKNLMMISTLVDSDIKPDDRVKGPLRRLVDDVNNLNRRIHTLEFDQMQKKYTQPVETYPASAPYFSPSVGTSTTPWTPGTIIGTGTGSYTLTSTTAVDDQFLPDSELLNQMVDQKYQTILNRLEGK